MALFCCPLHLSQFLGAGPSYDGGVSVLQVFSGVFVAAVVWMLHCDSSTQCNVTAMRSLQYILFACQAAYCTREHQPAGSVALHCAIRCVKLSTNFLHNTCCWLMQRQVNISVEFCISENIVRLRITLETVLLICRVWCHVTWCWDWVKSWQGCPGSGGVRLSFFSTVVDARSQPPASGGLPLGKDPVEYFGGL